MNDACGSLPIMIAVAMREEAKVKAVVVTVLNTRHVMSIFVCLGAALQASDCEQADSDRARQRDDVLAHRRFLWLRCSKLFDAIAKHTGADLNRA